MRERILHADFRERPFWWDAYTPAAATLEEVPARTAVAVIGAGYAGLSTALELARLRIEATVFDAREPGYGASTRSGGLVGGGGSVKKPLMSPAPDATRAAALNAEARAAYDLVETLVARENIDCGWTPSGRLLCAWTPAHFAAMRARAEALRSFGDTGTRLLEPQQLRGEIGSDFYHGAMFTEQAAHLHPALYYAGLLRLCEQAGIRICAHAGLHRLRQDEPDWHLESARGPCRAGEVVIATNGYTGAVTPQFRRRLVPLGAYIIATEPLPDGLAQELSPCNRSFVESRRVAAFYRLCPQRRRMIFGSRVKWRDISAAEMAPLLHRLMVERFPQLAASRITHAWTGNVALTLDEQPHLGVQRGLHYALGCNGSGIATMTYMGQQLARRIAGNFPPSAYDAGPFPAHPLYSGRSRWFLPPLGNYLRLRDWWERRNAAPPAPPTPESS